MIRYSTESMANAADKIKNLISEIKDELAKMDSISTKVEDAIQGGNAGTTLSDKIKAKKKELSAVVDNLEKIVPILNDTRNSLVENDNKISNIISQI